MSHLISVELDFDIAKRILKDLRDLPIGVVEDLPDLIFAIEEAIDKG
jgi:hypothetical protein